MHHIEKHVQMFNSCQSYIFWSGVKFTRCSYLEYESFIPTNYRILIHTQCQDNQKRRGKVQKCGFKNHFWGLFFWRLLFQWKRAVSRCGQRPTFCLFLSVPSGAAAENMLGSLLCLPGSGSVLLDPYGSTISETTSEAWSVEVLPSDSGLFCCFLWLLKPWRSCVCACMHVCPCVHISVCSMGVGTPGVAARHSISEMCECSCHHICAH